MTTVTHFSAGNYWNWRIFLFQMTLFNFLKAQYAAFVLYCLQNTSFKLGPSCSAQLDQDNNSDQESKRKDEEG